MQVHLSGNSIPIVKSSPQHTSSPFMAATSLATILEKLVSKKWESQIFITEEYRWEEVVPAIAHFRVILVLMNRIYKEEVLLNNRSQIVSISKAIAWPTRSLGIQASVYRCKTWIEAFYKYVG